MSFQRSRLNIDSLGAESREGFVEKAMRQNSPFSERSPIPLTVRRSINLLASNSHDDIRQFWDRQICLLRRLVEERKSRSDSWYSRAPPELKNSHRRFPLDIWATLMGLFELGGSKWLDQFVFGFSISGELSQRFAFPPSAVKLPAQLSRGEVFLSAPARFQKRCKRAPPMAAELWEEALEQVRAGWLEPPRSLSTEGKFCDEPLKPLNPTFRFAVAQTSKVRACDDLKDSLTNRLCTISTPITLPDWDLLAAMREVIIESSSDDWAFLKGDDTSAYKNLPLAPRDADVSAITLWDLGLSCWRAFLPRTLMFGATASVLRYNTFSRILAALINCILGIPLIAFYDDLGSPIPYALGEDALRAVTEVCEILGAILKPSKCEWGGSLTFLGLLGSFPSAANGWELSLSLTEEKIAQWSAQIEFFLKEGSISFTDLQKLIGRLSFDDLWEMCAGLPSPDVLMATCTILYTKYFLDYGRNYALVDITASIFPHANCFDTPYIPGFHHFHRCIIQRWKREVGCLPFPSRHLFDEGECHFGRFM